jgi:hypothetical protein
MVKIEDINILEEDMEYVHKNKGVMQEKFKDIFVDIKK